MRGFAARLDGLDLEGAGEVAKRIVNSNSRTTTFVQKPGGEGHLQLSYAAAEAHLEEAFARMHTSLARLPR